MRSFVYIMLLGFSAFAFSESDWSKYLVTPIPDGTCSFEGERLCPSVPGHVVEENLRYGACGASLNRLCGHVKPGEGRLASCLRANSGSLDYECVTWGKKVGLDFTAGKLNKKKDGGITPDADDYFNAFAEQKDLCAGSSYFMDSNCRKEAPSQVPTAPTGVDNFGLPSTTLPSLTPPAIPAQIDLKSLLIPLEIPSASLEAPSALPGQALGLP